MAADDGTLGLKRIGEELAAMRSELDRHVAFVAATLTRIEAKLASETGLLARAEASERRLRELGEQADELVRALSEARATLRQTGR